MRVVMPDREALYVTAPQTRIEHDLLGDRDVPADAYYGVHTLRAVENFPISGLPDLDLPGPDPRARVRQAGGGARRTTSSACSTRSQADAIVSACEEISGRAGCTTSSSSTSSRAARARRPT